MKQWSKVIVSTALGATLVVIGAGSAFAHGNFGTWQSRTPEQQQQFREHRQQIEDAMNAGDYTAWHDLVAADGRESKILDLITADNFSQFVHAHQLMQQAHDIMKQIGLPDRGDWHHGMDEQDESQSTAPSVNP